MRERPLGVCWSRYESSAISPLAEVAPGRVDMVLEAVVSFDDVDWHHTLVQSVDIPGEFEVRLSGGATVRLLTATVDQTGEVFKIDGVPRAGPDAFDRLSEPMMS